MPNFRFTYTRCRPNGQPIESTAETLFAHTARSAKHALVKRFGLQNWSPWRETANGFVKTRTTYAYRGKIVVEELPVASYELTVKRKT